VLNNTRLMLLRSTIIIGRISEIDHGQWQGNLPKNLNLAIPPVRSADLIAFTHKVNTIGPDINKILSH